MNASCLARYITSVFFSGPIWQPKRLIINQTVELLGSREPYISQIRFSCCQMASMVDTIVANLWLEMHQWPELSGPEATI
jgi:hypothetical protein